jgi:hypothetical protein
MTTMTTSPLPIIFTHHSLAVPNFVTHNTPTFYYVPQAGNDVRLEVLDRGIKKITEQVVRPALKQIKDELESSLGPSFSFLNYDFLIKYVFSCHLYPISHSSVLLKP